jgi:hypothetical protein
MFICYVASDGVGSNVKWQPVGDASSSHSKRPTEANQLQPEPLN